MLRLGIQSKRTSIKSQSKPTKRRVMPTVPSRRYTQFQSSKPSNFAIPPQPSLVQKDIRKRSPVGILAYDPTFHSKKTYHTDSRAKTKKRPAQSTSTPPRTLQITELIEEFDRFATNHPELCSKRNLDGPWVVNKVNIEEFGDETQLLYDVADHIGDEAKLRAAFQKTKLTEEEQAHFFSIFIRKVPIYITYGHKSTYCEDYDGKSGSNLSPIGFALRILFRAYFQDGELDDFIETLNEPLKVDLDVNEVIDYIKAHLLPKGKNDVQILVDGPKRTRIFESFHIAWKNLRRAFVGYFRGDMVSCFLMAHIQETSKHSADGVNTNGK